MTNTESDVLEAMLRSMAKADSQIRQRTVQELGKRTIGGSQSEDFTEAIHAALINTLDDESPVVRLEAARHVAEFNKILATKCVYRELDSSYHHIRHTALKALVGLIKLPKALRILTRILLTDTHSGVRKAAAEQLSRCNDRKRSVAAVAEALQGQSDVVIKETIAAFSDAFFVEQLHKIMNTTTLINFATSTQVSTVPVVEDTIKEHAATVLDAAEDQLMVIAEQIDAFRQEKTGQLQNAINAYLKAQAPQTYEKKQTLVEIVNASLDKLALAIRYKDQPCNLSTTVGANYPNGRFLITAKGGRAPLLARVNLPDLLPIELMDTQPHRDSSKRMGRA
jgi:hypothetical protein